jgi:hypothetical protein
VDKACAREVAPLIDSDDAPLAARLLSVLHHISIDIASPSESTGCIDVVTVRALGLRTGTPLRCSSYRTLCTFRCLYDGAFSTPTSSSTSGNPPRMRV